MIRFAVILSLLPLLAGTAAASAQTAADQRNSGCARDVAKYSQSELWRHGRSHMLEGTPCEGEQKVRRDLGGARPVTQPRAESCQRV